MLRNKATYPINQHVVLTCDKCHPIVSKFKFHHTYYMRKDDLVTRCDDARTDKRPCVLSYLAFYANWHNMTKHTGRVQAIIATSANTS